MEGGEGGGWWKVVMVDFDDAILGCLEARSRVSLAVTLPTLFRLHRSNLFSGTGWVSVTSHPSHVLFDD